MGLGDFFRRKRVEKTVINNYYGQAQSGPVTRPVPPKGPAAYTPSSRVPISGPASNRPVAPPRPQRPVVNNYNTYNTPPAGYAPAPMGYPMTYFGGRPGYYDPLGTFIELEILEDIFDGGDRHGNETIINNDNTYVDNSSQDSNNNVDTQDWGQQDTGGYDYSQQDTSQDSGYTDTGSGDSGYSYDNGSSYDTGSYDTGGGYDSSSSGGFDGGW